MEEQDISYELKSALPNKSINEDGTTTDLAGNVVDLETADDAWKNKPALPNKWLNPDGTTSTLIEIVASIVDTDIFVVVEELPQTGNPKKIYIVPNGDGGFDEYRWTGTKWDNIGMIEFDITQYDTKDQVNAKIATALQAAKDYTDAQIGTLMDYVDRQDRQTLTFANTSATEKANTAESNAKAYADTKKAEAISSANSYTDTAIQTSITQVLGGNY